MKKILWFLSVAILIQFISTPCFSALYLKESSGQTVKLGPFLDDGDGVTEEDALTITQADVLLSKLGGALTQKNEGTSCSHDTLGYYACDLDTTDTNFVGRLQIVVHESGALPVFADYEVLDSAVWDSLHGTDYLQTHTVEMTAGVITATVMATDSITTDEIATGAIDADAIAASAITSSELATNCIGADEIAANAITDADIANDVQVDVVTIETVDATDNIRDSVLADSTTFNGADIATILTDTAAYDTDAEHATALWNAATASYGGGGTYGQAAEDTLTYAISSAAWGSINSGVVFRGTVTADDPGVSFTIAGLAAQGVGAFVDVNTPWYAYVFRDAGGAAAAPQGEIKAITGYTSATGLFTTAAFSVAVATGDDVIIMSGRIAAIPEIKTVVDTIQAKTDNLPADPCDDSDIDAQLVAIDNYVDTEVADILTDTGTTLDNLVDDLETRIPGAISISGGVVEANIVEVQDDAVPDNADGFLEVNVAEIEDQLLSANVGGNFEVFFENGGAVTTKTVNDVGVAGSGLTSQQVWEYGTRTLTAGGSGATAQEVWEYSGTRALSAGPGSTEATITVTVEGIAVDNVKVWITSDSAGTNVTGGPFYTNTDGEVDFTIDYGATYYVWREHGGYNFTNPQTWTPTQ